MSPNGNAAFAGLSQEAGSLRLAIYRKQVEIVRLAKGIVTREIDMELFGESLTFAAAFFLLLALALALSFEFVNGFHDTANAVATVIYTNTLKPWIAVVWAGCWNLAGVLWASGAVAYSVVALLPVELVLHAGSGAGFAMIFALLISAIVWNVGTWYLGLPASSSHTLIGSIMGVGVANALMAGHSWSDGINWPKAQEIFTYLIISPIFGFCLAGLLLLILKFLVRREDLYKAPEGKNPPPLWIRCVLMLTCTLVSFFHGSNDGQKGMGLIMLILVGIVPGAFALNMATAPEASQKAIVQMQTVATSLQPMAGTTTLSQEAAQQELTAYITPTGPKASAKTYAALVTESTFIATSLTAVPDIKSVPREARTSLRSDMYLVDESLGKILKKNLITDTAAAKNLKEAKGSLDKITKYIPTWVKVAVALALGCGTMIGWKRIVVTVGEKIGKSHLTYAQGASAELVAASTIGVADFMGFPVSTTHVLSSGIAGTMAANGSGLQKDTLISILLAWVLTLPVCVFLGATLFAASLYVTFHVFGIH
jgi:PiT family inorganic phosphate transporter